VKSLLGLLFFLPLSAMATTTCSVSATALNFGSITFLQTSNVLSASTIDVTCSSAGVPLSVGLSDAGTVGSTGTGLLKNATGASIVFNLYQDAGRTMPWGQNAGKNLSTTSPAHATVYGSIPCSQGGHVFAAGSYSDAVQVSVTF
jgi:spore coat protein U-like protein